MMKWESTLEEMDFGITKLDGHDIFLGYDWLMEHNPEINWKTGAFGFQDVRINVKRWNGSGGVIYPWISKSPNILLKEIRSEGNCTTAYHGFTKAFEEDI